MRAAIGFLSCAIRADRILARDERIPRPLRRLAAVGVLPVPGPFDEAVLLLVASVFALFYRTPRQKAWEAASAERSAPR